LEYQRQNKINSGGQGEVWHSLNSSGESVAQKFVKVPVGLSDVGDELRRFAREIACQQELKHPGIVPIIEARLDAPNPFYVMPLAGGSLRGMLDERVGGLPEDVVVDIFTKILDAVVYAHRENVLHRDLKPENILFFNGEPALGDFGLGRRLQSGSTTITVTNVGLGTLQYSAPEQLMNGHTVDVRADIYSLGRILYEMLCGKTAYPSMDLLNVPAHYRHLIMLATDNDPNRRHSSTVELAREFRMLAGGSDSVRSPADRVEALLSAFARGDDTQADATALETLLVQHSDDSFLYLHVLPKASITALKALAKSQETFRHIIRVFDEVSDGSFAFAFTDDLGNFLRKVFQSTRDIEVRAAALNRTLILGTTHNRFFVRDRFLDMAEVALRDETYPPIIARIFRDNPQSKDFAGQQLAERVSLPRILRLELAS